jgi:NTE family protein
MKTALVLSGGGVFGAYQAGVWKFLSERWRPDLVVGASVGSLNAWAIAGGATGDELISRWKEADFSGRLRWRFPRSPLGGVVDFRHMEGMLREFHARYEPRTDVGVVLTELPRLKLRVWQGQAVTWRVLAASCAVLGIFPQQQIDGRSYCDGGMLGSLPLWAATHLGATRIIAVPVMPPVPFPLRVVLQTAKRFSTAPSVSPDVEVLTIGPEKPLGAVRDLLRWDRGRIDGWIEQGYRDAEVAYKHF